jgi:hypothetical protein
VRFDVFTAVRMMMLFFWVLAPYGLASRCQRFGEHTVSIFNLHGDKIQKKNVMKIFCLIFVV